MLQVITCKCGMDYAAAVIPHNQDADFQKAIARGAKLGHTICEKPLDGFVFQKCLCKKVKSVKQLKINF
jgi:hypothetical protein